MLKIYTEPKEAISGTYFICEFISDDVIKFGMMIPSEGDKISYTWEEFKNNTEDYEHHRHTALMRRVKF